MKEILDDFMTEESGEKFQKETKYYPNKLQGGMLNWSNKPEIYKEYPNSKKIELPTFDSIKSMPLDEVLKKRKSIRNFSKNPINLEQLSYLLWASTGIQRIEHSYEFRTAPSAGALYPIETYLVNNNVENLEQGLYHYNIKQHLLEELKLGDFRKDITLAALGQKMCYESSVVFVWTAIFYRAKWKYKERAFRYIYMEVGHIAQNLALSAVNLGLGSCQVGAFFDDEVNNIFNIDNNKESVIYLSVVGYPQ